MFRLRHIGCFLVGFLSGWNSECVGGNGASLALTVLICVIIGIFPHRNIKLLGRRLPL